MSSNGKIVAQEKNGPSSELRPMAQRDDAASGPLLSAEEEMQYQRAMWVNRLLKEELAAQTRGLSIEEIEMQQEQILANMREATKMAALPEALSSKTPLSARSYVVRSTNTQPASVASSTINRRRRDEKIRRENLVFGRRLQNVKGVVTPRGTPGSGRPMAKEPERSRLMPLPPEA
jgi:hypothetical protein